MSTDGSTSPDSRAPGLGPADGPNRLSITHGLAGPDGELNLDGATTALRWQTVRTPMLNPAL
jgi:hypothetical protein